MSVQLETKPEYLKTRYTQEELEFIYSQYEAFFNEMGSFLAFMMPMVKGLMIQFKDENLDHTTPQGVTINNGVLHLEQEWISEARGLSLPQAPLRITAMASS